MRALFGGYDAARGVAAVRLWRDGAWRAVLVDDRMPCKDAAAGCGGGKDGGGGGPALGRCRDRAALWMPLLEKAFAKAHGGSYSSLVGGHVGEVRVLSSLSLSLSEVSLSLCPTVSF